MPPKGSHHSEASKKKMSDSAKLRIWPQEDIDRRNDAIRKRYQEDSTIAEKLSKKFSGTGNPMYGKTHTPEARIKISEGNKNHIWTPEEQILRSIKFQLLSKKYKGEGGPFYGRHHTSENKAILSKSNSGRKRSAKVIKQIKINSTGENNGMYGKRHPPEVKLQISVSRKGQCVGEEG